MQTSILKKTKPEIHLGGAVYKVFIYDVFP